MSNLPPEYCPYCGADLEPVDPPRAHYCADCDQPVFYNPTAAARVVVTDGDAMVLNKIDFEGSSLWCSPGGVVEAGEDPGVVDQDTDLAGENPAEAAVRELAEETGLSADPDDLVCFDMLNFVKFERRHRLQILFAVDADDVQGQLGAEPAPDSETDDDSADGRRWADDDPAAVRYWTPAELAASDQSLTSETPPEYDTLEKWITAANAALTAWD